ncbi:triple tyrosine motif-containing protein [Parabacteroides bouchesdurhonensis]|uniref:helix-turn-helix and ligand-binding sensor domain-containing protein n=1 Tax=Parabacteroides bouchesdurhonensis TaxID=1936995 RepID=UPI000E5295E7|nr:triple tyrosine motif-containing protein [Parabacteroides bouchesdurhonensis]RHJ92993.1 transcriptional regulator [Bacteroides sp. AM07-16]
MFKLPLTILFTLLTTIAVYASVVPPSILIQNYNVDDYKASCQNWALSVSNNGILYVANNSGLLAFDGNTWRLYPLPDNSVITGLTYFEDKIYTRTENNTYGYWTPDNFGKLIYHPINELPNGVGFNRDTAPYPLPEEILKAHPTAYATIDDLHFIGTETDGLYITDQEKNILLHLHHRNQLQDNLIRAICVQDKKLIWLALDNGLAKIELNPSIVLLGERSLIGKLQNVALHDDELYIQTNKGYFKRTLQSNDKFQAITQQEALPFLIKNKNSEEISDVNELFRNAKDLGEFANAKSIYPAPDNLYWLIHGNEAGLFHREGKTGTMKCRILFDNYHLNLVTRGQEIFPLTGSLFIVSTMQGILLADTRRLIESNLGNPSLRFTQIDYADNDSIYNLPLNNTKSISLPHDFKEMNVYIGSSIFTQNNQISYKIDGVSSKWSPWQKDGKISFLQLPEGTYELKVRKYVIKGPYPELSLIITVRPPWYNSIWAYITYILLIWITIQLGLHYYLKSLRKEEQDKINAERLAEQQKIHQVKNEMLEAELQDKKNELTLQTSALVKKNQSMQTLLEELDKQKESLGDRYPNKMYNRLRSLIEETLNDQDSWIIFENYFNSAHQNFTNRLRQQYADITVGDLRICCFLRMNLSTKEIASLLNISIRAVELRRYRLRKRLGLPGDTNLVDFLIGF